MGFVRDKIHMAYSTWLFCTQIFEKDATGVEWHRVKLVTHVTI